MKRTRWAFAGVILGAIVLGMTALPRAAGQESKPPQAPVVEVVPVRYASAQELQPLLQQILGRTHPEGAKALMHVDMRTNSLILSARTADELAPVKQILRTLDTKAMQHDGTEQSVRSYPLRSREPSSTLQEALQMTVTPAGGKFVIDHARHMLLVSGNERAAQAAEAVIRALDEPVANRPAAEFQLRVVWLATGVEGKEVQPVPDDLKEVVNELASIGVKQPRLVSQSLLNARAGAPFQMRGTPTLGEPVDLSIQGTIGAITPAGPDLQIMINARQPAVTGRTTTASGTVAQSTSMRSLCELGTQIVAPTGHFVVLGVTPTHAMTWVFVVQVTQRKATAGK